MHKVDPAHLDHVFNIVAERTGVSIDEMTARATAGDRYRNHIRIARHVAYWTAYRTGRGMTLGTIAKRFGRTYSAARHGVSVIEDLRGKDDELRMLTDELREQLSAGAAP